MSRLEFLWTTLRSSFWFVPSLMFAASIALAIGLIEIDTGQARPWIEQWPRLFGAGAAGSRGMLTTIAASMMTVVGVTFSMTLVTLALASSQYTPRILRNFMSDRVTQVVLGMFGGIFIYCLIVLRTVRGGDDDYVPSLAVFFGVVVAVGGIAILVYFIHHIATAIQASSIIESVARETLASIDRQFPGQDSRDKRSVVKAARPEAPAPGDSSQKVLAARIGYIQSIDVCALVRLAHANDAVIVIERGVGEFVVHEAEMASMTSKGSLPAMLADNAAAAFNIYRFRTIEQDVGFGIHQLVDIALRALSPSTNDTTTGIMCVDYLSAILARLADRPFPPREHYCEGVLRVVTTEQTFESLLSDAFDPIRSSARGNLAVLARMLEALNAVGVATRDAQRRRALVEYLACMQEMRESLLSTRERAQYDRSLGNTQLALAPLPRAADVRSAG